MLIKVNRLFETNQLEIFNLKSDDEIKKLVANCFCSVTINKTFGGKDFSAGMYDFHKMMNDYRIERRKTGTLENALQYMCNKLQKHHCGKCEVKTMRTVQCRRVRTAATKNQVNDSVDYLFNSK